MSINTNGAAENIFVCIALIVKGCGYKVSIDNFFYLQITLIFKRSIISLNQIEVVRICWLTKIMKNNLSAVYWIAHEHQNNRQ